MWLHRPAGPGAYVTRREVARYPLPKGQELVEHEYGPYVLDVVEVLGRLYAAPRRGSRALREVPNGGRYEWRAVEPHEVSPTRPWLAPGATEPMRDDPDE